ncbi:pentatricopeptide repeat-containing protein At1g06710, mitochondrial [Aristolochia californica]|uniref:pentatricopeptide repeat-containing protein At1g06710, mitochondrial n=1 Tax=Aristolochia californica TaxID=171875 RepID=UPI0035D74130
MTRRWVKMILSRSPAILSSIKPDPLFPSRSSKLKIPLFNFSTGSPEDDLSGLVDTEFSVSSNGAVLAREKLVSPQDFAFLNQSVFDYDADSRPPDSCKFSDDAVLIASTIKISGSGFDDKTQKFLRQFREKLNNSLVIDVLKLLKSPEVAVKFFIWAGRQIGYHHTGPTFNALLETLGVGENSRVPEHFFQEIRDDDREILGKLLNILVRRCCKNGFWNEALEELRRLKDFGYKPSKATYNALIQVLLKAERLDSAFLLHREMSSSGISMDAFTLGCFARSLCKAGKWREALGIIEKEEFVPDTVIYTKMISGLCEASLFEEAMDFLHRMRSSSCVPNVVTYTILLSSFLKKRQLGRCKRIINMMITEGCNPSFSMFNSLVHAYCSSREYGYAYKLIKKMVGCGCRAGYVTYNILIGGICGNEDLPSIEALELAEEVYNEMLEEGFVLNKINVANFARCLCGARKYEKAFSVIREMMHKGFTPDTSTYTKVIEFLCQAHKVENAFLLFEEMKRNSVTPDVFTYTILIDSFCKVGLIGQARKWFNEMLRDGCAPNVVTYTALIHAYLKARRVSEANELFDRMLTSGCVPNVVTYSALIDGLSKAGEVEKACHVYARMRGAGIVQDMDSYFEHDGSSTIEPNVFTYGALVDGLCKAHKIVQARDLLEAMEKAGCEPNNVVYDALIDGLCKVGKLDEAREVFVKMSKHGYSPNVYTYSSLIDRLFKDRRLDLALKVLSKMLETCVPNVVTYTELIDGLCKVGKTEEAHKVLVMMEEKGCCPNVVTYTAMIDGLGKAGKIELGLDLFKAMTLKGCAPNYVTYRVLVNHCCSVGLLDIAHNLLEEMKQTYWPVPASAYLDVIQGFNKEFITSLGLLEEISEYESVPLIPTYRVLIDSFRKAGKLEMALELHKELLALPSCSTITSISIYSSLIESLCLASKVEKAFELYGDMTRRGHIPEIGVFFYLIKGLIKVNKWDLALLLSDCLCHTDIHVRFRSQSLDGG